MKPAVLLSIYSEHAQSIYSGKKRYEYRTKRPIKDIEYLLFYETGEVGAITGAARIEEILEDSPTAIWTKTKYYAGISRDYFRSYFSGRKKAYAYRISEAIPFTESVALNEFGICRPPQSFQYVDWTKAEATLENNLQASQL